MDNPLRDEEIGHAASPDGRTDVAPCEVRLSHELGSKLLKELAKARSPDTTFSMTVRTSRSERGNDLLAPQFGVGDYSTGSAEFEVLSVNFDDQASCLNQKTAWRPKCHLTPRETEVLTWVGRGKTSAEIATILGVSTRTVDFHCAQAMGRLDVMNRTQAVAKAIAEGLITT
jgi:DNA-binding CsgD family transcriptional regulator